MCEAKMKRSGGFTIIEMLVTMAVLAIIAAFAAPSYNNLMRSIRIDGDLSSIRSTLTYARSEAVNAQDFVGVCSSNNATACTGEDDWSVGWIVFVDVNDDQNYIAADDALLRVWEGPLSPNATLLETNARSMVIYDEDGMVSGDVISLEMRVEACGVGEQRDIGVTAVGRLDVQVGDCP
jgi:type IV fimbrial biogenesis protein FimT